MRRVLLLGLIAVIGCGGYFGNRTLHSAPHSPVVAAPSGMGVSHSSPSGSPYLASCAPLQVATPVGVPHQPGATSRESVAVIASQAICGALRELDLIW